ncbi:hypothetical protein GCM10028801_36740 [Nocardioides maradonensis]
MAPNRRDVREVVRRSADVAGLLEVRADRQLVTRLEEAVRENAGLGVRLAALVEELEQAVVPLLERDAELRGER